METPAPEPRNRTAEQKAESRKLLAERNAEFWQQKAESLGRQLEDEGVPWDVFLIGFAAGVFVVLVLYVWLA